jgi:hypothetical protein
MRSAASWLWVYWVTVRSTFSALRQTGLGWLAPLVVVLFLLALVLALAGSTGALAPFVYPLI